MIIFPHQQLTPKHYKDDRELVEITTKDLNKMLKQKNISKQRQKEIKQRRRTLKNW
jgi:hypothetical protein